MTWPREIANAMDVCEGSRLEVHYDPTRRTATVRKAAG